MASGSDLEISIDPRHLRGLHNPLLTGLLNSHPLVLRMILVVGKAGAGAHGRDNRLLGRSSSGISVRASMVCCVLRVLNGIVGVAGKGAGRGAAFVSVGTKRGH